MGVTEYETKIHTMKSCLSLQCYSSQKTLSLKGDKAELQY